MQVRLRDFYAVELALQHGANHNFYTLSFTLAKQTKLACFEKFSGSIARFLTPVYWANVTL
ncbi:hypothetical protein AM363_07205 [Citrobacter freundii]|uniref:Uncharacterized protein n=1 Tax=Citrobacter freundii TaxID=546 RepID=A0AA44NHC6_CITFR|nr:hypothetical protein [Citrobacter freundii]AUZ68096.1 hypothetical protein C2U41_01050 [Citrobacter freundii complex sp. CFNIH4]POU14013.1 hypothetical protein C3368_06900 [Citrobacter freundii complex sp. CFNIH7]POU17811.1 hypothetical protein C3381_04755 [Citrobacter freundii complex sp. CFNIH6]POU24223.1 hypothetical protein C3391_00345 [Citrobacter freundii complex sp. CFNIH8]POV55803.1 hypothetical protein C3404_28075 [Citrobacter freundii complex sp. CFNIH11]PSF24899.1 hypothetical p